MNLCISYDCEGNWGCLDWKSPYLSDDKRGKLHDAYKKIIELHECYDIKATFAFVGFYVMSHEERLEVIKEYYDTDLIDSYPSLNSVNGCWDGAENLELVLKNEQLFEIGSHGLTHLIFSNLNSEQISNEILLSKQILEEKTNRKIVSFIYPRNDVKNSSMVSKVYDIYRNTPATNAAIKIVDLFRSVTGCSYHPEKEISDFIFWKGGVRRYFNDSGWRKGWQKKICGANRNYHNKLIHAWSHPHNFVTDESLFERLEWFLKLVSQHRDSINDYKLSELKDIRL